MGKSLFRILLATLIVLVIGVLAFITWTRYENNKNKSFADTLPFFTAQECSASGGHLVSCSMGYNCPNNEKLMGKISDVLCMMSCCR